MTEVVMDAREAARVAALHEGHCPSCLGRLRPLTPEEAEVASLWGAPPHAWCASCHRVVGWSYDGPPFWFAGRHPGVAQDDVLGHLMPAGPRVPYDWWTDEQRATYERLVRPS